MASTALDRTRARIRDDFPAYALNCLKIRPKDGNLIPLKLNRAQQYIHDALEQQLRDTGKVRAIILKGRQQGCSTYVEARYMWKVTHRLGVQAFILTHEEPATKALFNMAKRYYEHLPPFCQPVIEKNNEKALTFGKLDSGYALGTAGNKSVGRSQTNQYFHGSEVAFWANASEHAKGILQTVPDGEGTEVIYESTANGLGNFFHEQWKLAEAGNSDFIPIFTPWYWQEEYSRDEEITPTEEEQKLLDRYPVTLGNIAWRRNKIRDLSVDGRDGERAFRQEYPMNAAEAFQTSGAIGLIKAESVEAARHHRANPGQTFLVGVDPSRGGDRFAIVRRAGAKAWGYEKHVKDEVSTLGQQVAICKKILDTEDPVVKKTPDLMVIDAGGGDALVDRLHELGYKDRVIAVNFGASTLYPEKYINKRGEMWGEMNAWLTDENLRAEIPDNDEVQADLCASPYQRDSRDRMVLRSKAWILSEYGFSPDSGDALALTFCGRQPKKRGKIKYPKLALT